MSDDGWRHVGRVAALFRHPIKSMAGMSMQSAIVDRYGVTGDRRFALRRREDTSGFPWLTAGKLPALIRYRVQLGRGDDLARSSMQVLTPSDSLLPCNDDSLSRHFKTVHDVDVELAHLKAGMFDWSGISIITTQTLATIARTLTVPIDARRFRPNIVVETLGDAEPLPENAWVGSSIAFGSASDGVSVAITDLDERCSMLNLDPDTGASAPEILRTVVREFGNHAGVYGVPTRVGEVRVGDAVYVR